MRRALFGLWVVWLGGCNLALRDALSRAEAAHGRGDHFGEALALKEACTAAPDEPEICRTAKEAADEVVAKQLVTVQGPCATEPNACLAALDVLAPFAAAEDPRLTPYFDQAGAMLAERCGRAPLESNEDAVFHVRCVEAYRKRVPTAAFAAAIDTERARAGAWVDRAATAAAAQPGVAWLNASLAACLGGSAAYGPRAQAYRAQFDAAHLIELVVSGQSGFDNRALCTELQRGAGAAVACGRGARALPLQLDAWVDQMTDAPVREVRAVEVLDHTERWENPDYRHAQSNLRRARKEHDEAANGARLARAECESAESALSRAKSCTSCRERTTKDNACNRESAANDIEGREKRQLRDAERAASNTAMWLTRDVFRTVSYRNVEHRFAVPWHVRVVAGGAPPFERGGTFTFESTEREGVPAANISYAPYSEPSQAQRREGLGQVVMEQAQLALTAELDRLAQARLAVCPAPNQWSDCQVEAALLRRSDPVAQFVNDVGAKLDARTGTPWPPAACAP